MGESFEVTFVVKSLCESRFEGTFIESLWENRFEATVIQKALCDIVVRGDFLLTPKSF